MNKTLLAILGVLGVGMSQLAAAQSSRDYISIVGSSTVYPFTTTVAERFGRGGSFKTPKVESTGTGGGLKLFCAGVGVQHPDIANASRRIKASELETCAKNGVKEVVELKIGYDGIVIAESKKAKPMKLSRAQVFLALAKQVPDPANLSKLVANPYTSWNQIDKGLPAQKIEVLGPPPTSGTRDSFLELYMEAGCSSVAWIKTLKETNETRFKKICHTLREDGAFIEAGENDNLIVQKIEANPGSLGIFGYSFLEENLGQLRGAVIDGVEPDYETISSGKYPASRPLFIYVKKAHVGVIPGIKEFIAEYVSSKAIGEDGYLAERGLVAPTKAELAKSRSDAASLKALKL
ncbi:MAG: PstS family phosphate ABC transporter substrate-binding protein [Steroidobacteraceae bacterium]